MVVVTTRPTTSTFFRFRELTGTWILVSHNCATSRYPTEFGIANKRQELLVPLLLKALAAYARQDQAEDRVQRPLVFKELFWADPGL